jgi:hypothetical protein
MAVSRSRRRGQMNRAQPVLVQRVVILIGLLVIAAMVIYPPWLAAREDTPGHGDIRIGRHLLLAPPSHVEGLPPEWRVHVKGVNWRELLGEVGLVVLFTGALWLALGRKSQRPSH